MRLSRSMLWGAALGALAGVAATLISLFQFDRKETTATEVLAVGLLVGVPVTTATGTLAGCVWSLFFGGKVSSAPEGETSNQRGQVGQRQPGPRRKKRR